MKKLLVGTLATIGGIVVLLFVLGIAVRIFGSKPGQVPARAILTLDLEQEFHEYTQPDALAEVLQEPAMTVRDVVEAFHRAARDPRVVGLVARIGAAPMGLAHIQEIRDAVQAFRERGKTAIAYAETFGEFGPGNGAYYLATAFDSIYLQPSGDIGLTGLTFETPFLRGTLEKLSLTPRLDHRHEYKNALNHFTERSYTEPHREALQQVMASQFNQIMRGIASGRRLDETVVRQHINRGPFLGQEALEAGLVDALAYRDEVYEKVQAQFGMEAKLLDLGAYLERAGGAYDKGETIALIYGVGGVQRGESSYNPIGDGMTMGSDTVAAAFREAVKDNDVKAIIFRVDSPGGSYVASDTIWRETVRAREAGKPVIVSMSNVAGSGGYFVAMAADKIVAQPGTITGSIGVVGGKFVTAGFWELLGLSWDEVHSSDNALMWSSLQDYTPEQWQRLQHWLDRVYADFTSKVAKGRKLPQDKVLEVAKGRIWTGEDAKQIGLVDELGGFAVALRLAREAAGLAADADVRLQQFPPQQSLFETLLARFFGREQDSKEEVRATVALLRQHRHLWQPLLHLARQAGLLAPQGVLRMPELPREP